MTVQDTENVVLAHIARYPDADPQDLYKHAYQAIMGPAHAILGGASALGALRAEAVDLDLNFGHDQDVCETLHKSRGIARIHLRPYLRAGGTLERLADAFVKSATPPNKDAQLDLARLLATYRQTLSQPGVLFDAAGFDKTVHQMAVNSFPPVHHSEAFVGCYEPHYRVVLLEMF